MRCKILTVKFQLPKFYSENFLHTPQIILTPPPAVAPLTISLTSASVITAVPSVIVTITTIPSVVVTVTTAAIATATPATAIATLTVAFSAATVVVSVVAIASAAAAVTTLAFAFRTSALGIGMDVASATVFAAD